MKKISLTILSFLVFLAVNGQNTRVEISQMGIFSSEDYSQSKVYFNQESALTEITIAKMQTQKDREFWGIQIYLGSGKESRSIASSTVNSFKSKYPEVEARLLYPSPYFKVQVGNFKTRIEAESFRRKILGDYPNARVETALNSKEK